MQIKFSSRHVQVTPPIEAYASKKLEKLPRYFDRVNHVEVAIDKGKHGFRVEMITDVDRHEPFVATADHEDLYAALDVAVDRLLRQIKDHKSRLRDDKDHTPIVGRQV